MKIGLNIQRAFGVLVVLAVGIGYFLYLRGTIHDVEPLLRPVEEPAIVGDLTDLVNVFIGTTGGGHVFPGATLPHGMVKAGMDTDSPGNVSVFFLSYGLRSIFCVARRLRCGPAIQRYWIQSTS